MAKNWYRLDTAALIFPAIKRKDWSNAFRVSATLDEEIDISLMERAAKDLRSRFPFYYVSLHKGLFWYYLEETDEDIKVKDDFAYPLTFMSKKELKKCCVRLLVYRKRIAAEVFHSVTDGRGGMIYLSTLLSRYLYLKYGTKVKAEGIVLDADAVPSAEELEESFFRYASDAPGGRKDPVCYRLHGTAEKDGFRHLTTGIVDTKKLLDTAHSYKVSVSTFLAAVMAKCIIEMQAKEKRKRKQRYVKVTLPIDLRKLYGSRTLKNFTFLLNVGVDPKLGEYSFEDLCSTMYHQLKAYNTPQYMSGQISDNVRPQKNLFLRLAPLFIKNFVMRLVYMRTGESGSCINISNMGEVTLPKEMNDHVERMEFIIGPQISYPNNCSVCSFKGKTYISMIRSIKESELERRFFSFLVELGIGVEIETNGD